MEIAKSLAGFTPGEADPCARPWARRSPKSSRSSASSSPQGAAKNRYADKLGQQDLRPASPKFGGYGFNKSHAAAYGLVAYQTAYLKANYPLEFMTALMNSEIGRSAVGKEEEDSKLVTYIQDVNRSGSSCSRPAFRHRAYVLKQAAAICKIECLPVGSARTADASSICHAADGVEG